MRNAMLTLKTTLKTATSGTLGSVLKPALFAVLMWAASAAGAVPIPGTPVPITLQTFVVMLAALMLPWKQAGAAMLMYLAAGAVGLPVFAGGASTMALVGPSAGFLIGFLPAAVVTSLLKGEARTDSLKHGALTAARYLFACVAGNESHGSHRDDRQRNAGDGGLHDEAKQIVKHNAAGDAVKAVVASAVVAGLAKLK